MREGSFEGYWCEGTAFEIGIELLEVDFREFGKERRPANEVDVRVMRAIRRALTIFDL